MSTIPFAPKGNGSAGVPILGQPFTLLTYTILPIIRCNCERGDALQLIVSQDGMISVPAKCSGCGHTYIVQGVRASADGKLSFGIATLPPTSETPA